MNNSDTAWFAIRARRRLNGVSMSTTTLKSLEDFNHVSDITIILSWLSSMWSAMASVLFRHDWALTYHTRTPWSRVVLTCLHTGNVIQLCTFRLRCGNVGTQRSELLSRSVLRCYDRHVEKRLKMQSWRRRRFIRQVWRDLVSLVA